MKRRQEKEIGGGSVEEEEKFNQVYLKFIGYCYGYVLEMFYCFNFFLSLKWFIFQLYCV